MLSFIGNKYNPNNIGLYRDEVLAIFENTSGCNLNKFQKIFRNKGLDIAINRYMKTVNYLDLTLNLTA